jgi:hypothetical protein
MTSVPPEKSIPSGRPLVAIVAAPAPMTSSDRSIACRPHRVKLTLALANSVKGLVMLSDRAAEQRRRRTSSNIVLDANTAVKTFAIRPIVKVVAKPRMNVVPN